MAIATLTARTGVPGGYGLVESLGVLVPFLGWLALGKCAGASLDAWKAWLVARGHMVGLVVLVLLGGVLLAGAVGGRR